MHDEVRFQRLKHLIGVHEDSLESILGMIAKQQPGMLWGENDPPSDNILAARIRAKLYGAKVITYRHFLRMILNRGDHWQNISKQIIDYAEKGIRALENSTMAFYGMKGGRLIVTSVWGTAHA